MRFLLLFGVPNARVWRTRRQAKNLFEKKRKEEEAGEDKDGDDDDKEADNEDGDEDGNGDGDGRDQEDGPEASEGAPEANMDP